MFPLLHPEPGERSGDLDEEGEKSVELLDSFLHHGMKKPIENSTPEAVRACGGNSSAHGFRYEGVLSPVCRHLGRDGFEVLPYRNVDSPSVREESLGRMLDFSPVLVDRGERWFVWSVEDRVQLEAVLGAGPLLPALLETGKRALDSTV